ncbi:hypothetical protein ACQP2F_00320 [Actinoplanes sp. CA-030573]|uniref:hypothetical protein n=1 Tax=Actinoplanes sp. CA-030573 TaxID=3239898 RepID=UPI003D8CDE81
MLGKQTVSGLRRSDNHFTTVMPFKWLLDNFASGLVLEDALRDIDQGFTVDERVAQLAPMRAKMQRPFQRTVVQKRSVNGQSVSVSVLDPTPKLKNTKGPLRDYLLRQFADSSEEHFGVLPGFVGVWPEKMPAAPVKADIPGYAAVWTEYDFSNLGRGTLADGECRHLCGLYINADQSVSQALKDKLLNKLVTIEIYHGITVEQAAQMFVDLNYEGTPMDKITKANIDPRNKWVWAAKKIFEELGVRLATDGRQITHTHRVHGELLMLTHAEQMVKAVALGAYKASGKTIAKRDAEYVADLDWERVHRAGVEWFGEIFRHFGGPEILVDESRVVRSIPIRLALAGLGQHFLLGNEQGIREARQALRDINWLVNETWNGIAGKVTRNEGGQSRLSASGAKENITKAVQAVSKPDTKAGRLVRGLSAPIEDAVAA